MIYESESDVDGKRVNTRIQTVTNTRIQTEMATAAMMMVTDDGGEGSGETEGSNVESVDGDVIEGDENRPPQGTGTSHVTGGGQGTHGSSGMTTTRGRRSGKEVKSNYKWEEVGAGE